MLPTWTPSELESESSPLAGKAWRVVEHQHTHATRKLVDTQQEQQLLEDILDASKPVYPDAVVNYDYLLKTPFRYQPVNRYGSRFRRAGSRKGVFYASNTLRTALAETAYYRIRFFQATDSELLPRPRAQLTAFTIEYAATHHVDLTRPPLSRDADSWTSMTSYHATQHFADAARDANIDLITYASVRDDSSGANYAILEPTAFKRREPVDRQTWYFYLTPVEAHFSRALATGPEDHCIFDRSRFDAMPSIVP